MYLEKRAAKSGPRDEGGVFYLLQMVSERMKHDFISEIRYNASYYFREWIMPELPEVETIVQELNASSIVGRKITQAEVSYDRLIATPTRSQFLSAVVGQKIIKMGRLGKYIVFHLSCGYLLVHLRMTGKFTFTPPANHERARLYLDDERVLYYADQRKFGRFSWAQTLDCLNSIGIDPLSSAFTQEALQSLLLRHARAIKPWLLDQKYLSGMGNIYVDEALWEAKIHPKRLSNSLSEKEIHSLYFAIKKVLDKGIKNLGTSLGSFPANYFSLSGKKGGNQYQLNVFRCENKPCSRCGQIIVKLKMFNRGTHVCPFCQVEDDAGL